MEVKYCKAYIDKRNNDLYLDKDWFLTASKTQTNEPFNLSYKISTNVPSTVAFSLYNAGEINHPYVDDNCFQIRDLDKYFWYYKKEFAIDNLHKKEKIYLTFEGVSYSCRVWLNSVELGAHNGHLGGPIFDVTDFIKFDTKNELYVEVTSATFGMDCTKDLWQRCFDSQTLMPWAVLKDNMTSNGCFTPLGIWREVRLSFLNSVHIDRPYLATEKIENDKAYMRLTAEIVDNTFDITQYCMPDTTFNMPFPYFGFAAHGLAIKTGEMSLKLTLTNKDGKEITVNKNFNKYDTKQAQSYIYENQLIDFNFVIENPDLWYPIGLGNPNLYDCKLALLCDNEVLDTVEFKVGIKTVTVDYTANEKLNHFTEKYRFSVNGKDFFLKGINWMPTDQLWNFDEKTLKWNLLLAKNAGIQMLRVWNGGGYIEDDLFYNLCDEYGILVWQDLVLCNNDKPNIVFAELDEQIALNIYRIRNHASLAVYCGGNELNPDSQNNYAGMYIQMRNVKYLDPYRYFYPTTPYGGSAHVYRDFEPIWFRKQYKFMPFLAESGMHCYPSYESLKKQVDKLPNLAKELMDSDFCDKYKGLAARLIENDITRIPQMFSRTSQIVDIQNSTFNDFCNATQLANAENYFIMVEALREKYPVCGGIMPWVFIRPWLSVGVQIVDGLGQPTVSYYYLKKTYEKINGIVSFNELFFAPNEEVSLPVKVVNESGEDLLISTVLDIYDKTFNLVGSYKKAMDLRANEYLKEAFTYNFNLSDKFTDSFFFVRLRVMKDETVINEKIYWPRCLRTFSNKDFCENYRKEPQANLVFDNNPYLANQLRDNSGKQLKIDIEKLLENEYLLTIENIDTKPIFPVAIKTDDITFATDNYFFLAVGEVKTVKITTKYTNSEIKVGTLF